MDYLPMLVVLVALAVMYRFCIRPMRSGSCAMNGTTTRDCEVERELELARTELELLRRQQGTGAGAAL